MFRDRRLTWVAAWAGVRAFRSPCWAGGPAWTNAYARFAAEWKRGAAPYGDFGVEYPPGAMLVFAAAGALAHESPIHAFAAMLCADLAMLALRAMGVVEARIVHEYGAFHGPGRVPDVLAACSLPVAAAALTTAVYPHLSEELVRPGPRHALAVALVCGRNLLLIALYVAAVGVLVRGGSLLSLSSPSERSAAR